MNNKNKLIMALGILIIITAGLGIFYTNGGQNFTVTNIYGQEIEMYGDGVYAYNSMLKVGATKGTDGAAIVFAIMLMGFTIAERKNRKYRFCKTGLLFVIVYISVCLSMGITMNRLFLLYVMQLSLSLYLFFFELYEIGKTDYFREEFYNKSWRGTAIYLMVGGCSTLVWLTYVLPVVLRGIPMEIIEIYTTEPTFVMDLGILLPGCILCGMAIIRQKKVGYHVAPILLTFITCVGFSVIFQTIAQLLLGISMTTGQLFGLVISFVILGVIAVRLLYKILSYVE